MMAEMKALCFSSSCSGKLLLLLLFSLMISISSQSLAQETPPVDDSLEVMKAFNEDAQEKQAVYELKTEDKHKILFYMGLALLVLLLATAYLGISMVFLNRDVFILHMISAGLTVTLGVAHAVVAVVWFFPF